MSAPFVGHCIILINVVIAVVVVVFSAAVNFVFTCRLGYRVAQNFTPKNNIVLLIARMALKCPEINLLILKP